MKKAVKKSVSKDAKKVNSKNKRSVTREKPVITTYTENTLVHYYLDGWRYGYLESTVGEMSTIKPIPARGGAIPKSVRIASSDVVREWTL